MSEISALVGLCLRSFRLDKRRIRIGWPNPSGNRSLALEIPFVEIFPTLLEYWVGVENVRVVANETRIPLLDQFRYQLMAESVLDLRIRRIVGQVAHAVWIGLQIVEFLFRPFAERQGPEVGFFRIGSQLKNFRFGRTAIAIQVACFGVAGWPALRLEVLQVKVGFRNDSPDGVAYIARPPDIMLLFADQNAVSVGVDFPFFLRLKKGHQAFAGCWAQPGFLPVEVGCLNYGGSKVDEAYKVCYDTAGLGDAMAPAYSHGKMVRVVLALAFHSWKGHAVVRERDEQSVFQFAALYQRLDHQSELPVEVFDFQSVV